MKSCTEAVDASPLFYRSPETPPVKPMMKSINVCFFASQGPSHLPSTAGLYFQALIIAIRRSMETRGPLRRFLRLPRRKRPKEDSSESPTATRLTWDTIRTALELVNDSADVCPPLKSAAGGVVALCNLAERLAACDENAEMLAWRSVTILDTIYHSIDPDAHTIPVHFLDGILQFEKVINEIRTAMEAITKKNRVLRVLHLRRNESQLAKFTTRLDSATEVFTIHSMMSLARIEDKVEGVSVVASTIEHSNNLLHNRVELLQLQLQVAIVFFWPDPNTP
ncbi:hypothetical protein MSAN_00846600 [Mycena sanguinolenta]|uniref:Uncharacterized protein n=1 Tax=Mycena sanguinolenta TaxID=230812 RepID=A0A8H6YZG8_9AGAR|nr:hypothetical protein MSAN_00846600 [Mycena sanguinolenta]